MYLTINFYFTPLAYDLPLYDVKTELLQEHFGAGTNLGCRFRYRTVRRAVLSTGTRELQDRPT